jgi:four helix bundle protein
MKTIQTAKRFEQLEIWKNSRELSRDIYHLFKLKSHPADRPLSLQIIRSSGSISDNIAEGFERGGNKEFLQYLWIAKASAGECRSQLYRAFDNEMINEDEFNIFKQRSEDVSVKIYRFIQHIKSSGLKGQKYKP